jgi:hypothetical protein
MVVAIVLAAILMTFFSAPTFADSAITTGSAAVTVPIDSAEFVIGMNQYFVNNQTPGINMDAAPYIDSGRTLVPVRYLADALGATTVWDGDTQEVAVSNSVYAITMTIGSTTLTVNGQAQTMDAAPVINDGRTFLPARYVAEALGYDVDWDATNQIVVIYPMSSIGEPPYNFVIQQAQQNAAKPEQVQKLESALGITMGGSDWSWGYDPEMNADGSSNIAWENQNMSNSFVVAGYDSSNDEIDVDIDCATLVSDPSQVSWDISPLQKVLEAFFPGQEADIQQAMADAQQDVANAEKYHGGNPLPANVLMINGTKVGISQGNGLTFAGLMILGS